MAVHNLVSAMRFMFPLLLLLLAKGNAQSTAPSNDTSPLVGEVGFLMQTTLNSTSNMIKLVPLTNQAGLGLTPGQLQQFTPVGALFLTNANTVQNLKVGDIAYLSCEASDYSGQIDADRTMNFAVNARPSAIVLFSEYSARCSFSPTDEFSYTSLFTTEDSTSSAAVLAGLKNNNPPNPNTSIKVDPGSVNGTQNGGSGGSVLGRSPTTAVAMIILYSITGIITALFLIIIIVGAIRAHRHPERYGPRRIVGRQRQSRAKGIARAMLETLPIVKFGDLEEEENKPVEQRREGDVEMGVRDPEHEETPVAGTERSEDHAEASKTETANSEVTNPEAGDGPEAAEAVTTEAVAGSTAVLPSGTVETGTPAVDNGLACSVCVEDFVKGVDVRVLPCKHRFHPECIDPWLLNVSGTCPLCRTDLRPTASHGQEDEDAPFNPGPPNTTSSLDAATTATFNETTRRNRRSRILHTLNIGSMRNATPQERIAALRRLRNENISGDSTPPTPRRSRFGQRLGRAFGSRPHSGAASPRPTSSAPSVDEHGISVDGQLSNGLESRAEEPSTAEVSGSTALPTMTEVPSNVEMPHLEEAQVAEAPHAAGSAHAVQVRRSGEADRTIEEPHTSADAHPTESSHTTVESIPVTNPSTALDTIETSPTAQHQPTNAAPSTSATPTAETGYSTPPESSSPLAPQASSESGSPGSTHGPHIETFYAYR